MNRRYAVAVACLGIAACAAPGPELPESSANPEGSATAHHTTAAEAVVVEHTVPAEAKSAGLIDEDTVVCRKEKEVGSHIPKLVCLSAADREKTREISRLYMDATKRAPGASPQER